MHLTDAQKFRILGWSCAAWSVASFAMLLVAALAPWLLPNIHPVVAIVMHGGAAVLLGLFAWLILTGEIE